MAKLASEDVMERVSEEDAKYLKKYGDKLSGSIQYAKWIGITDEHEDHPGQSLVTRNHEVIQQWAEERGAVPATVAGTEYDDELRVLRLNFPGYGGENLARVSWERWLETFEARDLAFLFQEHLKDGNQSNFFRLQSPHREDG